MKQNLTNDYFDDNNPRKSYNVRLPGFLIEKEIGLGDVFNRVTYVFRIKPCRGCKQRADLMNRWVTFSR